jgi:MoaA/NifB/PqqE/SkfB family radical SAM enzyme
MAHMVVTRRCNLTCGYCFEADRVSPPVPLAVLKERVDHLARLRTVFVTITGGEPLLHPELLDLVQYVTDAGMTPVMNSNAYLLTKDKIVALGKAGLFAMQVSIDNVRPNDITQKSLKPLMPKLRLLSEHAAFRVRINSVLGSGTPEQAVEVARAAVAFGFDAKCSLVRDEKGAVVRLTDEARRAYEEIRRLGRRAPSYLSEDFQLALAEKGEVSWRCRAGARYFTVCEDGLVHLCESSYGTPGKPLALYSEGDLRQAFHSSKACSRTCAVAYAHQASRLDRFRDQSRGVIEAEKGCWMQVKEVDNLVPLQRLKAR